MVEGQYVHGNGNFHHNYGDSDAVICHDVAVTYVLSFARLSDARIEQSYCLFIVCLILAYPESTSIHWLTISCTLSVNPSESLSGRDGKFQLDSMGDLAASGRTVTTSRSSRSIEQPGTPSGGLHESCPLLHIFDDRIHDTTFHGMVDAAVSCDLVKLDSERGSEKNCPSVDEIDMHVKHERSRELRAAMVALLMEKRALSKELADAQNLQVTRL